MTISSKRILESAELSSAAEVIAGIEDLVIGILLHLPVKSLLRFESVSKKWLSLISDPYFARNYVRRHNPNLEPSGLLLNHGYGEFKFVPFNDDGDQARFTLSYPNEPGIMISQSCNGLLMCISAFDWEEKRECYICNPTTKQFTTIRFPNTEFENDLVAIALAFDHLKSPRYKLICLRRVHETKTPTYQIDIYSSETGSWRPPISVDPIIFTLSLGMSFMTPVYWRGAIHWYSDMETSLYINTDTECLKRMPMPPFQEGFDYNNVRYFGESRGHLHLIVICDPSATEFDILELETDYSGWFVRYSVNLDAVMMTFPPDVTRVHNDHTDAFTVGCVVRADREKESTLVLFLSGKAVSFNLHDMTAKQLCDLVPCYMTAKQLCDLLPCYKYANLARGISFPYEWYDANQYIETLFSWN